MCTGGFREAKAHLELKLVRGMKGKQKDFYRYFHSKMKTRENITAEWGTGCSGKKKKEKSLRYLMSSLSVSAGKACLQESQSCKTSRKTSGGRGLA